MKSKLFFVVALITVLFISAPAPCQDEQITLSTYYPAPYGEYDELCAEKLLVDTPSAAELQDMARGDCHITNSLIVGAAAGGFSYDGIGGSLADGTVLIKGDVGIGTTVPGARLTVQTSDQRGAGSTALDGISIIRPDGAGTPSGIFFGQDTAGSSNYWENMIFQTLGGGSNFVFKSDVGSDGNPNEVMRITRDGNVGIGTTNPGSFLDSSGSQVTSLLLDVQPGTSQPGGIIVGSSGRTGAGTTRRQGYFLRRSDNWNSYPSGLWKGSDTSGSEYWENLVINNSGGGANIIFMTNLVEKMRIQADGNVGIGTASPGQKLTVAGTIETTSGGVKFPDGTTQTTAAAGFGSWTSISANTVYPAATDGFVMARGYFTATNGYIVIKTDGSNPPATTRQSKGGTDTTGSAYIYSIMCPVRKGDNYKVETGSFTILAIYWLPIGA